MSEAWERTLEEICDDAGIIWSPLLPWSTLAELVYEKWGPLTNLVPEKGGKLKDKTKESLRSKDVPHILNQESCAFCKRAVHDSGICDFGLAGETCLACILGGKCFDKDWVIQKIVQALIAGELDGFKKLVRDGLKDVKKIVRDSE